VEEAVLHAASGISVVYNPPVVDEALGLRKSSLLEGVRLVQDLLVGGLQSVVFVRSRRNVEIFVEVFAGRAPPSLRDTSPISEGNGGG